MVLGSDHPEVEIEQVIDVCLFDVRKNRSGPRGARKVVAAWKIVAVGLFASYFAWAAVRKLAVGGMEVLQAQANLLQVIRALRATCCFTGCLHGRQQQCHQNADDRDYHQ